MHGVCKRFSVIWSLCLRAISNRRLPVRVHPRHSPANHYLCSLFVAMSHDSERRRGFRLGRRANIIAALTVLVLGAGLWWYFQRQSAPAPTALVPADALAVLHFTEMPRQLDSSGLAAPFLTSPEGQALQQDLQLLAGSPLPMLLASLHPGANHSQWLLLVPQLNEQQVAQLQTNFDQQLPQLKPFSQRRFREQALTDFTFKGRRYSRALGPNFLAISSNALLVEQVIRIAQEETGGLGNLPAPTQGEAVGLHITASGWRHWLQELEVPATIPALLQHLSLVPGSDGIWPGQALPADSGLLAGVAQQDQPSLTLQSYIPLKAALVQRLALSNVAAWRQAQRSNSSVKADWQDDWSGEAAVCHIEDPMRTQPAQLVLLSVPDGMLAQRYTSASPGTYSEKQGKYTITELSARVGPQQVLGGFVAPGQNWFLISSSEKFLAFASQLGLARQYVLDLEQDEVWGGNWRQQQRLKPLDEGLNYGVYVQPARCLGLVRNLGLPLLNQWLAAHQGVMTAFDFVALQLKGSGGLLQSQLSLQPRQQRPATAAKATEVLAIALSDSAACPLVLVPAKQGLMAATASASGQVMMVNTKTKELLSKAAGLPLSDALVPDASAASPLVWVPLGKTLHGYDLTATRQHSFVYKLSEADAQPCGHDSLPPCDPAAAWQLQHLALLPAEQQARFVAFDFRKGWLLLQGSSITELPVPVRPVPEAAGPAQWLHAAGQSLVVAASRNGLLLAWTDKGELIDGYPLEVPDRLHNVPFVVAGSSLAQTQLHLLTDLGALLRYNLEGELVGRYQFYRPGAGARFDLLADPRRQAYAVAVHYKDQATFYSSTGDSLFTVPASAAASFQFVHYDALNRVIGVLEPGQGLSLYRDGRLLTPQPLPASSLARIIYSQAGSVYKVYTVSGRKVYQFEVAE